ncbi:isocitrate/isopropylmalate family dehydrogenase [Qaidamihabitans albus]|uniref:isocitrate/isopropylmalate family dehydrogenase n=1 Tax=Qaidamihabitans albus TaxID=2795733 RepID=UPI0018F1EB75|nr:isocitrate/isopropylmalate family dehydrogenase [Qaidamihabitans albus]
MKQWQLASATGNYGYHRVAVSPDSGVVTSRPDDESCRVIVAENLFGDILSDEVAGILGSLGLLPPGSLREENWDLHEPVHGAAPDIVGMDRANPTLPDGRD